MEEKEKDRENGKGWDGKGREGKEKIYKLIFANHERRQRGSGGRALEGGDNNLITKGSSGQHLVQKNTLLINP